MNASDLTRAQSALEDRKREARYAYALSMIAPTGHYRRVMTKAEERCNAGDGATYRQSLHDEIARLAAAEKDANDQYDQTVRQARRELGLSR